MTSNGPTGFTYDFANQPTAVTGPGAATYLYDGNLKRVKEVRGGKTIYNIYSLPNASLLPKLPQYCGPVVSKPFDKQALMALPHR